MIELSKRSIDVGIVVADIDVALAFYGEDTDTAKRVSRHGRVVFDPKLRQNTSARRFKAEGTLRISVLDLFHLFKVLYTGGKTSRQ